MTYDQLARYIERGTGRFRSREELARFLGFPSVGALNEWRRRGRIPYAHQMLLEQLSDGALKAGPKPVRTRRSGRQLAVSD